MRNKERKSLDIFEGRKLESIDIVFENCETYNIPADCIERANIDGLRNMLVIHPNGLSFSKEAGEIYSSPYCEEVILILNEKAMNIKTGFVFNEESTLKERLRVNDITHLDLNFDDNTHLYITVPWGSDDEYYNHAMKLYEKDSFIGIHIAEGDMLNEEEQVFEEYCDFFDDTDDDDYDAYDGFDDNYDQEEFTRQYQVNIDNTSNNKPLKNNFTLDTNDEDDSNLD